MQEQDKAPGKLDPAAFRAAMRTVPGAVAVITAEHEGERNGMTATAVCSVSAHPPQILVCVNVAASVCPLIAESGSFAVNFLSLDQIETAKLFSQSKLDADTRFAANEWTMLETRAPILSGASSVFECRVVSAMQQASHIIFIGEVAAVMSGDDAPLLYHAGQYSATQPLEAPPLRAAAM